MWECVRSSSAVLLAIGGFSESISKIWTFCGMDLILVSCSTGCGVHFPSLFPEFELFVGMGSILVCCSTGCAVDFPSLFPEFELFVEMCSILVSWFLLAVQAYFQNLNFFGNGFDPSAVLLAGRWIFRVYFQNLNFLWGWVRSSSAVPLAIWSNSRLSLRREDLG